MMTERRPRGECVSSSSPLSSWTMYGQLIRKKKRQDRLVLAIHEIHEDENDDEDHHHSEEHEEYEGEETEEQPRKRIVGTPSSEYAMNIATNVSIDRNHHHNYDFLYLFSILKLEVVVVRQPVATTCVQRTNTGDGGKDDDDSTATPTCTTSTSLEAVSVELVQCAPDPSAVVLALQGICEGRFPLEVMGTSTSLKSRQEARGILNMSSNQRARRLAIASLVRVLQGKDAYKRPRMRHPHIKQSEWQVLEHLRQTGMTGSAGWRLLEPKETTFLYGTTTTTTTTTTTIVSRGAGDDMKNKSNKSQQVIHNSQLNEEQRQQQEQQQRHHHEEVAQAGDMTSSNTTSPHGGDGDRHNHLPRPPLPLNLPDECLTGNQNIIATKNHYGMLMNRAERRGDRVDYILSKKLPQVRWMTQRVRQLHNNNGESSPPKHIVDVGGGRGDLATALALAFPTTLVTVIDKNQSSLNAAQEYARQLNCHGRMQFIHADMVDFVQNDDNNDDDENGTGGATITQRMIQKDGQPPVDLVVALHACGDLSDLALAFADKVNAAFVICPCCYTKRYNSPQFTPPWTKYCAAPTTPSTKDNYCHTLGRLAELNDRPQESRLAMKLINSMRLQSMKETNTSTTTAAAQRDKKKSYKVGLEEYDSACSQRNLVLVGVQ
jgi:16S rRNA G966 N2-methylase RsmD